MVSVQNLQEWQKFLKFFTLLNLLVAAYRSVFRTCSNICNGAFFVKILKLLTIFAKKVPSRCSTGLKIGVWLRVWNIKLTIASSLQIKSEKYSARKYVWHRFLKRCYEKFRRIHKKESVRDSLFWCFLVNFAKFVRTPFLQNSTEQLPLIIAISVETKGVLANETVSYGTKSTAYVLIWTGSVSY